MCAREDDPGEVGYPMKLITAFLKPGQFDEVMRTATDARARGLACGEVRSFGQQFGRVEPSAVPSGRGTSVAEAPLRHRPERKLGGRE